MEKDIQINDFANFVQNGTYKLSRVLSVYKSNTASVYDIEIIEDKSKLTVESGVLKKINIFTLMKSNCPDCGLVWKVEYDGVHELRSCTNCGDAEKICQKHRKKAIQDRST